VRQFEQEGNFLSHFRLSVLHFMHEIVDSDMMCSSSQGFAVDFAV
jgi:hypothetical protein